MLVPFDNKSYIAIIGDIKKSKQLNSRYEVQQKLSKLLDTINHDYEAEIVARLMITLGDEFQGLLKVSPAVIFIIDRIEREMYPVKIRVGIGVGEITTNINAAMPLGADGPAYYNARSVIEKLKVSEKKNKQRIANISILIQDNSELSELFNALFSLLAVVKKSWTARRMEIINAYLKHAGTQEEVGRALGIHQSNVQKALAATNFYTYWKSIESASKIFSCMREEKGV
jgi:hypothetical protein